MDGETKIPPYPTRNIVATIEINEAPTKTDEFLDNYNHCPLCGTEMLFTHTTHFLNNETREEAFCEPCNIRIRHSTHKLQ